jgi:nitrate reductase alpha subunit
MPRGCPRGAAFSWYTYSPTRVRYPYARGGLLEMYREAKQRLGDPVLAWADVVNDPDRRRRYHQARGKGGLVRVSWAEAVEMIAAAQVHTIKTYGPDRIAGFSPIPAMSMVSHCVGTRFTQLIGGVMTSFYDWYADLPVASPQVFGDQTDVPESGDWWDATYLMMWGSNVPVTRTPDAHWMAEVRYRGTKIVTVSPDYADNTKFADEWLPAQAGTDAALAIATGHVILKEFLDLEGITPALSIRDVDDDEVVEVLLPCFEAANGAGSVLRRGVPVIRIGDHLVTTVYDLMLAQYGVTRPDLPGNWPTGYDDPTTPYTPAWQAEITSVPATPASGSPASSQRTRSSPKGGP